MDPSLVPPPTVTQPSAARVSILDLRGPEAAEGALAIVCGLPVVMRNLLVLERVGWRAVVLVSPDQRQRVQAVLARHARPGVTATVLEDGGETLACLGGLLAGQPDEAQVLHVPGALSLGRRPPELPAATAELLSMGEARPEGPGVLLAPAGLWRDGLALTVKALTARWAAEGKVRRVPLPGGAIPVGRAGPAAAERALLRSLRKDADGVVARVDRFVSLAISRRLMALPVRPNHITGFAALMGLACGLLTAHGGYAFMLIGALAFQLNSILDGVDGEIARAKLLESRTGQWLDTVADDFSNFSFMVGAAVGSYRTWASPAYLVLGGIAGTSFLLTSAIMYHYLVTKAGSGDLNDFVMPWQGQSGQKSPSSATARPGLGRVLGSVQWVFRRDAYVFLCTLLALAGQLRVMVWLFALGTTATWLSIVLYRGLGPRVTAPVREP